MTESNFLGMTTGGLPMLHWVVHPHGRVDGSGWTRSCSKRRRGGERRDEDDVGSARSQGRWGGQAVDIIKIDCIHRKFSK